MATNSRLTSVSPPSKPPFRGRLIEPDLDFTTLSEEVIDIPLRRPGWRWICFFGFTLSLVAVLLGSISWLFWMGPGIWGINIPVAWGFAIINFVWWVGIGHAGTLISAILYLCKQEWRSSINRIAEAMTLFALTMAGLFPILHLGRPMRFFWLLPYPNTMQLWPQWRSGLVFDAFAVVTYFTVSLLFWYMGLVPDLATLRDTAKNKWQRRITGIFALGWRGAGRHWHRHQTAYLLLAGLLTPLVVSVHSIVSIDFAQGLTPGWHEDIFPPYFVASALYSGFAMLFTLALPIRKFYNLQDIITEHHLQSLGKLLMINGLIVAYSYIMETFVSVYYSGDIYERAHWIYLFNGRYLPVGIMILVCNCVVPLLLIPRKVRGTPWMLWIISILVNIGVWNDHYAIIVGGLYHSFMPSSWKPYHATMWDWLTYAGTVGAFLCLVLLLVRFIPLSSISELRKLLHEEQRDNPPTDTVTTYQKQMQRYEQRIAPDAEAAEVLPEASLFGICAEYTQAEQLVEAAREAHHAGYRDLDGYTPYPVPELFEALHFKGNMIAPLTLIGGMLGAGLTYYMCWYATTRNYLWNIGGRPYHSWPSYIPITFEMGVLAAALSGFVGVWLLCRLPMPYHSIMNAPNFERASRDRFFLCIETDDPMFDRERTASFLESTGALRVSEVKR